MSMVNSLYRIYFKIIVEPFFGKQYGSYFRLGVHGYDAEITMEYGE